MPGSSQQPRGQRPADWLRQLEQSTDQVDTARATDTQVDTLKSILHQNQRFVEVLQRAGRLALPDWYLAAGCVAQTVWNVVTGCPPGEGIRDYDLPYSDSADLSWDAEDRVIQAAARCFADCPCSVEVRNEARVHLWYENHFGVAAPRTRRPRRQLTRSPPGPAASASGWGQMTLGRSTRRTVFRTCSRW